MYRGSMRLAVDGGGKLEAADDGSKLKPKVCARARDGVWLMRRCCFGRGRLERGRAAVERGVGTRVQRLLNLITHPPHPPTTQTSTSLQEDYNMSLIEFELVPVS